MVKRGGMRNRLCTKANLKYGILIMINRVKLRVVSQIK